MVSKEERPYIIINCAASADGKIALPDKRQVRISSKEDFDRVMRLREECDAVLVGIGTVLTDDPKLNVKYDTSKQPAKVVLDTKLRIPEDAEVFKGGTKVYILTGKDAERTIEKENAEVLRCNLSKDGLIDLKEAMKLLRGKGIKRLLVEGGATVIWNFLKEGLFDEFNIYISPIIIGGAKTPTIADGDGVKNENEIIKLRLKEVKKLGDGLLIRYEPWK